MQNEIARPHDTLSPCSTALLPPDNRLPPVSPMVLELFFDQLLERMVFQCEIRVQPLELGVLFFDLP